MADSSPETDWKVDITPRDPRGYTRSGGAQDRFDAAAAALLEKDGWLNPMGVDELRADLALEGGGVKGIGLVGAVLVLAEAGYTFRGVAGTSAGAIVASLVAALSRRGRDMTELRSHMDSLDFREFQPRGLRNLGRGGPRGLSAGALALAELTWKTGLDSGDALGRWLTPILEGLGVRTFADLRLDEAQDPGMSLEADHQFRLVVHTADITRKQLVRLPWDFSRYGHPAGGQSVVDAVRASMSIPFYFKPFVFASEKATVAIPTPDGGTTEVTYEAGMETWVDGGMLRNFPINAFDRIDGRPPRWPTIGIKLSGLQAHHPPSKACGSSEGVGIHCLETMTGEWDEYSIDETTAARTIFVDTFGVKAIEFGLPPRQRSELLASGIRAATQFVVEMGEAGRVPRTATEAQDLVNCRRAGARLDADHRPVERTGFGPAGTCSLCSAPFGTPPNGRRGHAPPDGAAVARAHEWLGDRPPTAHRAVVHRGRTGLS